MLGPVITDSWPGPVRVSHWEDVPRGQTALTGLRHVWMAKVSDSDGRKGWSGAYPIPTTDLAAALPLS